jgi:hypothetical protein
MRWAEQQRQIQLRVKQKEAAAHKATQDAVFERRLPDPAADYDRLSGQQAPEEEAQVAAVSVFLSFVPCQMLKRTGQRSRENNFHCVRKGEVPPSMSRLGPSGYHLSALLGRHMKGSIVYLLVGTHIRIGIAGDRVIFAVEFAFLLLRIGVPSPSRPSVVTVTLSRIRRLL